ncbi:hypothetical protein [Oceanobacillus saliphilus]|uniref:hypothetical protein n=1 Tax=Oceanobacillus saliphilus TaxID=2925834 RepID=UPI00201D4789
MNLISLLELVKDNEIVFSLLYCCILLYINIGYLKEHKEIKENLGSISSDDEKEMLLTPDNLGMLLFSLTFNFFRRWMLYIIAILMTESTFILIISVVLFIIGLYDTVFNYSIAKLKKSNIGLYLAIVDTIYIVLFTLFLIFVK